MPKSCLPLRLGLIAALLCTLSLSACSLNEFLPGPPVAEEAASGSNVPIGARHFGVYLTGAPWSHEIGRERLELELGRSFDMVLWFTSFEDPFEPLPVERILAAGQLPIVTWQAHEVPLASIAAGEQDAYLRGWAQSIRTLDGDVYLRPLPEMNGDWVPWNGEPEVFKQAWRHMVELFRAEGADNVKWVWCPNITDWPRTEMNRFENYYPGTAYVDVLALDGFNWGTARPQHVWRSFDEVFAEPYERITKLGAQPLWLTEVASAEQGGDKAAWVKDMLSTTDYPQMEGVVWFNERKEADWRIESTARSLNAFASWFGSQALAEGR